MTHNIPNDDLLPGFNIDLTQYNRLNFQNMNAKKKCYR